MVADENRPALGCTDHGDIFRVQFTLTEYEADLLREQVDWGRSMIARVNDQTVYSPDGPRLPGTLLCTAIRYFQRELPGTGLHYFEHRASLVFSHRLNGWNRVIKPPGVWELVEPPIYESAAIASPEA